MEPTDVAAGMLALIAGSAKMAHDRIAVIGENATQVGTIIMNNLAHQHGGVGDDPGLIAALQTAAGSPRQGMSGGA